MLASNCILHRFCPHLSNVILTIYLVQYQHQLQTSKTLNMKFILPVTPGHFTHCVILLDFIFTQRSSLFRMCRINHKSSDVFYTFASKKVHLTLSSDWLADLLRIKVCSWTFLGQFGAFDKLLYELISFQFILYFMIPNVTLFKFCSVSCHQQCWVISLHN